MSQPFFYAASNDHSTGNASLSVTFLDDAQTFNFGPTHPSRREATAIVVAADTEFTAAETADPAKVAELKEKLENLQRIRAAVGTKLREVCEDVTYDGEHIYFQGEALETSLGKFLLDLLREENPQWKAVGKFLNKVMANPSKASRDSLFDWLRDRELTITAEGDFIAYKGLKFDENGTAVSIHSGPGIVDGVVMNGHLPNREGSVLEMPRGDVDANTSVGCSTGLHAGTWDYAHGFAQGVVVKVQINPAHVVSVPDDCEFKKLRVWKYLVLEVTEAPETVRVVADYATDENDWDDDSEEEYQCERCGDYLDEDEVDGRYSDEELCRYCATDREEDEEDEEAAEDEALAEAEQLALFDADQTQFDAEEELRTALHGESGAGKSDDEGDDEDGTAIRIVFPV